MTNLITDKEYTFRVTAVNEAGPGETSSSTPYIRISKLSASEPPTVLEPLKSIVTGLRETVILSCVIGGIPTPRITWYFFYCFFLPVKHANCQTQTIFKNLFFRLKDDKPFENSDITYENRVAKYIIQKTTETSSATFTVKAQNDVGTAETSCQLKIQESPKITCDENIMNQRLAVSDKWQIEIHFSGFPKPEVTWTKANKKITDKRISIKSEDNTSIIIISSLVRDDTAIYTAKATNEAGSASIECHLRVIGSYFLFYLFFTLFIYFSPFIIMYIN